MISGVGALCTAVIVVIAQASKEVAPDYYGHACRNLDLYRAYRDQRGFFLYLRSFRDSIFATTTNVFTAPEREDITYYTSWSLSQILDDALSKVGRVLFISNESTDLFAHYGLTIESTDEAWRSLFGDCAASARAILLAPGETPGVIEEMQAVTRGSLAEKTVWVMRPTDIAGERRRRWAAISEVMRGNGLDLPEYDERGALFVVAGDCWMVVAFRKWPTETQAIEDAFHQLIDAVGPERFAGGLPLCEILNRIRLRNQIPEDMPWIVPNARL